MNGLSVQDTHLAIGMLEEIDGRLWDVGADLGQPGPLSSERRQEIRRDLLVVAKQVRRLRAAMLESSASMHRAPGVVTDGTKELEEEW